MAFCTNCGSQLADDARFCPNCGQQGGNAAPRTATATEAAGPLEYSIQGDNLQVARIYLKPGQEIYAEAGKMVYKTANVHWETRLSGGSIGDKILGALRRTVMGESIFLTYFRSDGPGEVGFAGNYPGKITVFDLEPGRSANFLEHLTTLAHQDRLLPVTFAEDCGGDASQFGPFLELLHHHRSRVWNFLAGLGQDLFPDNLRHHEADGLVGDLVVWKVSRPFRQEPNQLVEKHIKAFTLAS